jgi:hypothetical protein
VALSAVVDMLTLAEDDFVEQVDAVADGRRVLGVRGRRRDHLHLSG